jgi:hypothetical protein
LERKTLVAGLSPALLAFAEQALTRLEDGRSTLLPRRVSGGYRWYLLVPPHSPIRAVRDEFIAHLGSGRAEDRGALRHLGDGGWEATAASLSSGATVTASFAEEEVGLLRARSLTAFWQRRELRPSRMPDSLPALLQRLDAAISGGSVRDVDEVLRSIVAHPEASSENRAFSRVRAYAGTGRYRDVLAIEDLTDIVYLPLPAAVRQDVLVSLYECVTGEAAGTDIPASIVAAPESARLARAAILVSGMSDPRALAVVAALSDDAALGVATAGETASRDAAQAVDLGDAELSADVVADVVGNADPVAAATLIERMPVDDVPSELAAVAALPTSVAAWADQLVSDPELALPDELMDPHILGNALEVDEDTVAKVCEALLDGPPDRSGAWFALPSICAALAEGDPLRPGRGAVAARLLEAVCIRDMPDTPALEAVASLLEAALASDATTYGGSVESIAGFCRSAVALRTVEWLADLLERLGSFAVLDRAAVGTLLDVALERTTTFAYALDLDVARLLARAARTLLGEERAAAFEAALLPSAAAVPADERFWEVLRDQMVGVYSLDPGQLNALASWVRERVATADVRRHDEENASAQLSATSRAALMMVVSIAASKHAATNSIEDARPPTRREHPYTVRLNQRGSAYGRRLITEAVRELAAQGAS